jgi:hypothetical protein
VPGELCRLLYLLRRCLILEVLYDKFHLDVLARLEMELRMTLDDVSLLKKNSLEFVLPSSELNIDIRHKVSICRWRASLMSQAP